MPIDNRKIKRKNFFLLLKPNYNLYLILIYITII